MAEDRIGGATVVTTMKNEGAFMVEWAAHYLALGFDRFVICTNDCEDPTVEIAKRLQALGFGRQHNTRKFDRTSMQRSALKQARRYPEVLTADWVYVADADEFLTIKVGDGSLRALIEAATPEVEVISVPWRIFGPSGVERYEDAPVTQQFHYASATPRRPAITPIYCKSLCRGDAHMFRLGIHAPVPHPELGRAFITELPGGKRIDNATKTIHVPSDYAVAQINHYALRSSDSFLVKRDRGRVNHSEQDMDVGYWDRFDIAVERCAAIRRYDAAAAEWRARLMADAEIARLHLAAVKWHRDRIADLKARPEWAETMAAIAQRQNRWMSLAS